MIIEVTRTIDENYGMQKLGFLAGTIYLSENNLFQIYARFSCKWKDLTCCRGRKIEISRTFKSIKEI